MRFLIGKKLVAVTCARGTVEDPTICFQIFKAASEITDKATIVVFGESGLIKKMSGTEYKSYADWAFCGGCPRFCRSLLVA